MLRGPHHNAGADGNCEASGQPFPAQPASLSSRACSAQTSTCDAQRVATSGPVIPSQPPVSS